MTEKQRERKDRHDSGTHRYCCGYESGSCTLKYLQPDHFELSLTVSM
jgi:hypothetical protein